MEVDRDRLTGLADVLGLRADRQLARLEGEPQRQRPLCHERRAANDVEQLRAGRGDLVLERLGQQLPVVGELAVDAAGREPDALHAEQDLVLADRHLDAVRVDSGGDPAELHERAGRHDGLGVAARPRDDGLLHAQPVAVGGGHGHPAVAELDQDAGQHGPRLVARGRPRDVVDRRNEGLAFERERGAGGLRQVGEVLGALGMQGVLARAAGDAHRAGAGRLLDRHLGLRQRADDLEQEPSGEHRRSRLVHLGRHRHAHGELHVGRRQLDRALGLGAHEHAGEDLDRRALRHAPGRDLQPAEQVILGTDDFHARTVTSRFNGF